MAGEPPEPALVGASLTVRASSAAPRA
jgi:hypothetical protein